MGKRSEKTVQGVEEVREEILYVEVLCYIEERR
jgi:hypothetical protein